MIDHTVVFTTIDSTAFISSRQGEIKLGEKCHHAFIQPPQDNCLFHIFGIQEDVGIRRNGGIGNQLGVYQEFLKSWLNIQSNPFLPAERMYIDGFFEISEETDDCLTLLDKYVSEKVESIVGQGRIPIVIGGGHNNSFGMIKGLSNAVAASVNVINLDVHADLRTTETRHSGNGFTFAYQMGYLKKYSILGLHEAYNNNYILETIDSSDDFKVHYFEDIVMRNKISFEEALQDSLHHVSTSYFGVEWDVDSMEGVLSSAMTPVGWHSHHVLRYLYESARRDALYLHISEAVAQRVDGHSNPLVGKMLSYAVQAFIKGHLDKK